MDQENFVKGCSMQRPPFIEPNGFCFWKARFDTYIKSKDIDLWQVIQNGDFYFAVQEKETNLMKETPYELLKDVEKKQLGKNKEAKMTIYNALPRKEYERVFMCKTIKEVWHTLIITHQGNSQDKNCKIDLLTQEYERTSPLVDDDVIKEQAVQNHDRIQNPNSELKEVMPGVENIREIRDHPADQVIGALDERTLRSHAQDRSNFFAFVSSIEHKNIKEAIKDESWTMAMQEELDQFVRNDV
nr:DUF4219 domain-containing protein/UBN2 domain-containing protein [Tanacetum cinerariifolium]